MPDTLSLSTGLSLGLVAGIVSGVCFLFANGYTRPRNGNRRLKARCPTTSVCDSCGGDDGGLLPCVCRHYQPLKFESGAWFLRQVQRTLSLMPWYSTDKLEQIDEEHEGSETSESRVDLHNVREFLEALSARLAGGALEGTRVAPLYDHPAYLPQTPGGIPGPTASASSAHAQLKRLVARVVEEAAALPALARYATEPHSPVESTYEDLLATAILNKVIERYQNENGSGGRSSGIHSASASPSPSERSSPRSLNSRSRRDIRDITPPLHEEDEVIEWEDGGAEEPIELPRRVPFPEYGGDIIHPTENAFRDFDEVSGSDIQAVDGSWEENWLFQKKKINTIQSVPVPMLVPNSNTDYKALIGDRDADDTTDLSDNASEDEGDVEYKSDVKRVLDSKHIIGGQQKLEELDFEPDSLTIVNGNESEDMLDSIENIIEEDDNKNLNKKEIIHGNNDSHDSIMVIGVNSGPISKTEFNLKEEIHRTVENGDHDGIDDDTSEPYSIGADIKCSESSFTYTSTPSINTLSRHEREGEYEETVTVPVQRYADSLRRKHFDVETDSQVTQDGAEDLIPGSIAYRERKKWLNYVDMPNNPYSPEAIQKRLSAKSTSSLFDSMTSKNNTNEQNNSMTHEDDSKMEPDSLDILEDNKNELTKSATTDCVSDRRSESPSSPRVLKDVLSEEIPQYKRYGRDYYIKEAKSSSGGRKYNYSETSSVTSSVNKSTSLDNFDTEFASPGLLIKQFNMIAVNQEYTKFADKEPISITTMPNEYKNEILIEYEDANEQTLFAAKPASIDDDTDRQFEEILQSAYKNENEQVAELIDEIIDEAQKSIEQEHSLNEHQSINEHQSLNEHSILSSSSLEDTIKIYNVQTGEIVKCKPEDNVSRYECDENDNKLISDKLGEDDKHSDTCASGEAIVITELEEPEKKLEAANELSDIPTELPNVRELAKKFLSMESLNESVKPSQNYTRRRKSKDNIMDEKPGAKLNYMHSLTARSISKEFRDELKLSMATPLTVPGGAKEIPEGTDDVTRESSRPGSPLPEPGTIKTKLAFFEGLKSKFSTK
ncbi:uncharacterized protein LOC121730115 isoform X2 [Aricia agestis]|uniref:uncharacterized protein LOC121730115 isoform X2 n=1 Tax=Aricia agestis TaxID=91739 RepID=UPI001C2047C9|nr:uncharacterized protein LOC121730115 isoform X2 [Aricia agestis]